MSQLLTAGEASKILNISKRTLFRWEQEGKIRSVRDGILKVRVYDKDYIDTVRQILDVNRDYEENLKQHAQIMENSKKFMLEQDYIPGKPLKLMTDDDVEASIKVSKAEDEWWAEHQRLFEKLFSFPIDIIKELLS